MTVIRGSQEVYTAQKRQQTHCPTSLIFQKPIQTTLPQVLHFTAPQLSPFKGLLFQGQPPESLSEMNLSHLFLQGEKARPYLDHGVSPGGSLDGSTAALGLVVRAVVRLGLHLDPQLVRARLAGQGPLQGWQGLHGQAGTQRERENSRDGPEKGGFSKH